jgi:S-adenosylmethionine:tRNA ribosyltransferase-isomerase
MTPADFHFELPSELIAQAPLPERTASRLLHLRPGGALDDLHFAELFQLLQPGDLLVMNDTRVVPARLYGQKASGGRIEILLEREPDPADPTLALVQLKASHGPKAGGGLSFDGGHNATVLGRQEEFYLLRFDAPVRQVLAAHGHIPLPPYLRRADEAADRERYQTVYAREPGAVAAPTAGLHFDGPLLATLRSRGVEQAALTLHVGAGTFAPLRPHHLKTGRLHSERLQVGADLVTAVHQCRQRGGRVVAVGTTAMRGLESAAVDGRLRPFTGETDLFIRPGYRFQICDALITNFHLPESSLLMLVAAFGGTDAVLAAYRHAVERRYRFFSYGDAMFVERRPA